MAGWVEIDREPHSRDGAAKGLVLNEEGVALHTDDRLVAARWDMVFGAERMGDRLFVMVPRRSPNPPWIAVGSEHLGPELRDEGLEGLERRIEARLSRRGYREAAPRRERVDPRALKRAVIARRELPGAVEVPVAGPSRRGKVTWPMIFFAPPGFAATVYGISWYLLFPVYTSSRAALVVGSTVVITAGLLVALLLLAVALFHEGRLPVVQRRVLVMSPDGFVIGFYRGVAAHAWSDVSRFEARAGKLVVVGRDGRTLGAVAAKWFGAPLLLIVAVATAYHEHARRF